jgi:hypothetical protein
MMTEGKDNIESRIYNAVKEIRALVILDFQNQLEYIRVLPEEVRKEKYMALTYFNNYHSFQKVDLVEETSYVFLIRLFLVLKITDSGLINKSNLKIPANLSRENILQSFGNLASQFFLYSDDYAEILIPDDSTLAKIQNAIYILKDTDSCTDDFLSTVYEAYIFYRENKEEYFTPGNENAVRASTQIYTPLWLCKMLAINTVGKLYKKMHPDIEIADLIPYESVDIRSGKLLEEIRIFDPACGCGNYLIASFDVLFELYLKKGYPKSEIPKLIIENNLFGFDTEDQAVQIAKINLYLKANKLSENIDFSFNIFSPSFAISIKSYDQLGEANKNEITEPVFKELLFELQNAFKFGSLLNFDHYKPDVLNSFERFAVNTRKNIFRSEISNLCAMFSLFTQKYDIILANPPFLLSYMYDDHLKDFLYKNYSGDLDTSYNIYACFVKRFTELLNDNGIVGAIHPASLFFDKNLSGFKSYLFNNFSFDFIFLTESNSLFPVMVKDFKVVIYSFRKNTEEKKKVLLYNIENSLNHEADWKSLIDNEVFRKIKTISLRKASFYLKHPFLYKKIFKYL